MTWHSRPWVPGHLLMFDIRDCFVFGGLGILSYGIWQVEQWLAFVVCGGILMLLGLGWLERGTK